MSVILAANDLLEVKVYCFARNQLGINVLHYRVFGNSAGYTDRQTADLLAGLFETPYVAVIGSEAVFAGVSLQILHPTDHATQFSSSVNTPGTSTEDLLPTQTCGIITKRTNTGGRTGRGRVYIPFPTEEHNDAEGNPDAGYQAVLDTLAAVIFDDIEFVDGTDTLTINPGLLRQEDYQFTPITGWTVRPRWGTQRSRGAYGASNLNPF